MAGMEEVNCLCNEEFARMNGVERNPGESDFDLGARTWMTAYWNIGSRESALFKKIRERGEINFSVDRGRRCSVAVGDAMDEFKIVRDAARYGDMGSQFPDAISVHGTKEQALRLANYLSDYFAGCDLLFTVEGCEESEHYKVTY
jgi:hypothetical protein